MGFSKFFLNAGEALRPVLTKIIPMKLLSKMKAGIINNATDKLSAHYSCTLSQSIIAFNITNYIDALFIFSRLVLRN